MNENNNSKLQKNQIKKVWFYDIEQMVNFHSCHFLSFDRKEERTFVIHESRNDLEAYLQFLSKEVRGLIGFNNLNYDYPMIHFLVTEIYNQKRIWDNANQINILLYIESQRIINTQFSAIAPWKILIPQLDLFKIYHFDNKNKSTSLKWIQSVIRWNNVEDLDLDFNAQVKNKDIPKILKYNKNDVDSTAEFYNHATQEIKLRKDVSKLYGFDATNMNDIKIGETLFLQFIEKKTGLTKKDIKSKIIPKETVVFKNCVLDYIQFKSKRFQEALIAIKNTTVSVDKKLDFKHVFIQDNVEFVFGSGGLHAQNDPGIYEIDDNHLIIDIDVGSFYSANAIFHGFYPEHLGEEFCDIYEDRFNYRMSIKPDKSKASEAGTWKLGLNGIFGKSKEKHSPFYDPQYTMKITVNGQLLLSMLIEALIMNIKELILIQANTDGLTVKIHKNSEQQLKNICWYWEKKTKLSLEYTNYKKFVMRDVNNYLTVYNKPEEELYPQFPEADWYDNNYTKHKTKGSFQVVPETNGKIAYHKDWSQRVVKKALYDYYIYGIPILESIKNNNDILDFCKTFRNKSGSKAIYVDNKANESNLTKTTRYYLSHVGGKIVKIYTSGKSCGKKEMVEADGRPIIFNKIENKHIVDYMIDYNYYIRECNKEINKIENKGKLKMF